MFENPAWFIGNAISKLLGLYFWIIFVRAILSWIRPDPYNPLVRLICKLVDPVTYRISRIIPVRAGMIDFSPFILMIIIMILQEIISRIIPGPGAIAF